VGNVNDSDACAWIEDATRDADVVAYFASAKGESFLSRQQCRDVDLNGLKKALVAAHLVDAHVVVITPLQAWHQRWTPWYWYGNWLIHRRGYYAATRGQERLFLNDDGTTEGTFVAQHCPQLRFALIRTKCLTYPSFGENFTIGKNNAINDPSMFQDVLRYGHRAGFLAGECCARRFSSLLWRGIGMHRSLWGNRVDIAGVRAGGECSAAPSLHSYNAVWGSL
jgi:hypothetical protein